MDFLRDEAGKVISRLHVNPAQPWIAGSNFTLADIFLSHTLFWAKLCGSKIDKGADSYLVRAMSRPAFLKAQERNNL